MLSKGIKDTINDLKQVDYICLLLKSNGDYYLMLYPENTGVMMDERLKKISEINLNEILFHQIEIQKELHLDTEEEEENDFLFIEEERRFLHEIQFNCIWRQTLEGNTAACNCRRC